VARPLEAWVNPNRGKSVVTKLATQVASARLGGPVRPETVDLFFAEYDAPLGEWLGRTDSTATEARKVWFVVFSGIEGTRASGVIRRRSPDSTLATSQPTTNPVPTTNPLRVLTDLVVVIDDVTGEVLVASEFLASFSSLRP
jgi:hypothetical protein